MNKQELINKVIANGIWCGYFNNKTDRYVKISKVKELIETLDETEKVIIPPFLDQYIQECKGESAADIFTEEWLFEGVTLYEQVAKCLYDNDQEENGKRYLLAVQAFVTGIYEVEKETLYEVVFLDDGDRYLLMELSEGSYEVVSETENDGYKKQRFTASEIKAIDNRYWKFAVPMDKIRTLPKWDLDSQTFATDPS